MTDNIGRFFDFLLVMTGREVKLRYRFTALGLLWAMIIPLFQMIVIGTIFSFFINISDYYLLLLTGLLPWRFFSTSISKATVSFVSERSLLQNAKFPKETIPLSIVITNLFHLLVSFSLLVTFVSFIGKFNFFFLPLFLLAVVWLLVFTIGFSLLTSSLYVQYRDVNFLVNSLLLLWFYATPVIYTLDLIPSDYWFIFLLNPLSSIFEFFHFSIVNQGSFNYQLILGNFIMSIIIAVSGVVVYYKRHPYFVDWL